MRWGKFLGAAVLAGVAAIGNLVAGENIVVGTTAGADEEILAKVQELAAAAGLTVKIVPFGDYVLPNKALAEKEIDLNAFQHLPYLQDYVAAHGDALVSIGTTYVTPMGVYSRRLKSLNDLRKGDRVALPNDATNEGRALLLLQKAGVIKLRPDAGLTATPIDVTENPLNLRLIEVDAAQTARSLDDVAVAAINTNFAVAAGLNPQADAIYLESSDSPYVNVIAARAADKDRPAYQKFLRLYQSQPVADFILQTYKGSTLPAFPYKAAEK
ncbi:metal ABC transporter substrate-binding protein [Planctomycetales bacterium]|nr:metal ABC transporter substrate-binding protein [Planctomycetales bacterium]GHV18776.1 metal ABC transporter substrate-binding protein [Planctomycetales bacterium]